MNTLMDLTIPWWQATATPALLAGLAAHQVLRPLELDSFAWRVLTTSLASVAGLFLFFLVFLPPATGVSAVSALLRTAIAAASFAGGLFGSMLVYRAWFHRLRRFPGPLGARLSRFYRVLRDARRLQAHLEDQRLHEKYGDFVRVGPREISVNRSSAVQVIYGPSSKCLRGPWYRFEGPDPVENSLMCDPSPESHKARKKAWERGLSFKALDVYEPRVTAKTDLLIARLAKSEGMPVDVTQLSMFYGFDIMGDIGYSKDFHMLESGQEIEAVTGIHENMVAFGLLGSVPWLMNILIHIPQASAKSSGSDFSVFCADQVAEKRKASRNTMKPAVKENQATSDEQMFGDVMSWLVKEEQEVSEQVHPKGKAMVEDSRLMIIAGSDTVAVTLANLLYYLTKHPRCYQKLQRLLHEEMSGGEADWRYPRVKNVPYVDYIIQETLRLKPSAIGALARVTPPEGIQIDEVFIPGNTVVSIPPWTIQRDPRYWENATDFIPERWETLSPDKAPWIPFTKGRYACPGKNLAMMELRMALSRIALGYDMNFVAEEDGQRFDRDTKDVFTLGISPLSLIFTRR